MATTKQKVAEQVDAAKYIPFKKKASFNPSLVKAAFGVTGLEEPKPGFYRLAPLGSKVDESKEWASYDPTDKIPSDQFKDLPYVPKYFTGEVDRNLTAVIDNVRAVSEDWEFGNDILESLNEMTLNNGSLPGQAGRYKKVRATKNNIIRDSKYIGEYNFTSVNQIGLDKNRAL